MYNNLTCLHASAPNARKLQTKPLWNRRVLCNVCKSITSVHDTAKGFWGISLRQSKADVTERIWDTLHRPDDTWSTGQRGYCVWFTTAVKYTVCVWMFYTNNELHKSFKQPQVSLVFTLLWCFTGPSAAGKEVRKSHLVLKDFWLKRWVLKMKTFL